jgi:hypothetical protein
MERGLLYGANPADIWTGHLLYTHLFVFKSFVLLWLYEWLGFLRWDNLEEPWGNSGQFAYPDNKDPKMQRTETASSLWFSGPKRDERSLRGQHKRKLMDVAENSVDGGWSKLAKCRPKWITVEFSKESCRLTALLNNGLRGNGLY